MKEKDLRKEEEKIFNDRENLKNEAMDQTAEEFIGDKADWSKDISEYKKRNKKGLK